MKEAVFVSSPAVPAPKRLINKINQEMRLRIFKFAMVALNIRFSFWVLEKIGIELF